MPPKLPVFLLCSVAITLVIDTKAFPCHRKAKISLYCIELQKTRNKLVSTSLQDIVVKQKVSLFIPAPWFHRKNSQPSMMIMTIYWAVFYVLLLEKFITGLSKMATKSTNANFSLSVCRSAEIVITCFPQNYYIGTDASHLAKPILRKKERLFCCLAYTV